MLYCEAKAQKSFEKMNNMRAYVFKFGHQIYPTEEMDWFIYPFYEIILRGKKLNNNSILNKHRLKM